MLFRCNQNSATESTWQILGVEKFITRDDYDTNTHENDIAILKLVETIEFNDVVQPVGLPDASTLEEYSVATVIGWGGIFPWVKCHNQKH